MQKLWFSVGDELWFSVVGTDFFVGLTGRVKTFWQSCFSQMFVFHPSSVARLIISAALATLSFCMMRRR